MVISSGAACRYGADGKRSHDTQSREISCRNADRTMGGRRFLHSASTVEMTRGVLANIVISSGDACRYGADGKRSHDTLSREISRVMLPVPSEKGDFSTPLRFGRNDGRGAANIVISSGDACRYGEDGKRFDDTLSREISCRNAARTIRERRFLHSAPTVEMTGGALANIVISSGDACWYEADGKRFDDTLSREISRVMLPVPSEEGDFSTPLRPSK